MNFGLTDEALALIRGVFQKMPQVASVKIFGSRATGTQRPNSDIDLALWGEIDFPALAHIAAELDELPLPFMFDVQLYDQITAPALKEHIDRIGHVIFSRNTPSDTSAEAAK